MSEPYFAEVLSRCTSVESAKDAWVRFGAPAWRELEAKLAEAARELNKRVVDRAALWTEKEALRARVEALAKALERYGAHDAECPVSMLSGPAGPCACGLRAALARKEGP